MSSIKAKQLPLIPKVPVASSAPRTKDLLAEWDFSGANTQYGTHSLHTYLAAMIPQLAEKLIVEYTPANATILDPFCGGGAVLVEAITHKREAVGREVNDLALVISKAKTTWIPETDILRTLLRIVTTTKNIPAPRPAFAKSDNIEFWFKPGNIQQLADLRQAIDLTLPEEGHLRTLFRTVFSATVRDVSLTYRNEIRLRRMRQDQIANFNVDAIERFIERATRAASSVSHLPNGSIADIAKCDVTCLNLRDDDCTTIICSPPYGDERNGVPYVQFAKNMALWLGHSRQELLESKKLTLGWHKDGKEAPESETLSRAIGRISSYPASVLEAEAFYHDYQRALKQMARVASDRIIVVVGQRVLQNTVFDNGEITIELMRSIGVDLEDKFLRKLPTKRLPRMRQFGAAIDHEAILIFKK